MKKNILETIVGAFVLIIAIYVGIIFISKSSNFKSSKDEFSLLAKFENADGIEQGSDVKIGGVKIGTILNKSVDYKSYNAILKFSIDKNLKIPDDSTAKIDSSGLLGDKHLSIVPGGSENMLALNEEIKYTQSSVNLETLIGKMIFSTKSTDNK